MTAEQDTPEFFADELVRETLARGAKVYRLPATGVFARTNDKEVALWLAGLGARAYRPVDTTPALEHSPPGGYTQGDRVEWDLWIHIIPVLGEESVWDAAGRVSVPMVGAETFR